MSARVVRWAVPPAAIVLALATGLAPAGAGTATGWRITQVLSGSSTDLREMATSGPDNAVKIGRAHV